MIQPDAFAPVHILNPLENPFGGSEQRSIALFNLLRQFTATTLWSEGTPAEALEAQVPISLIEPQLGLFPQSGVLVIVGVYFPITEWIARTSFRRVVLVYNTVHLTELLVALNFLAIWGVKNVEMVFASQWLQGSTGLPGRSEPSPIDVSRFSPAKERPARPFTIGRMSRDIAEKHHREDPQLYRQAVAAGCRVRIMGGTVLGAELGESDGIELLPCGAEDADEFLRSLDCFVYRTGDGWVETFGRVVAEAMATGLAVVVEDRGGVPENFRDGDSGFLFTTSAGALERIIELKNDPEMRHAVGVRARREIELRYSVTALREIAQTYLL